MKQTVTECAFMDAFDYCRSENFSCEGRRALFNYFEELEEDTGEEIEFDVIAICCDFTEYEDLKELQGVYWDIKSMRDLQDNTIVIDIPDTTRFIIQNY